MEYFLLWLLCLGSISYYGLWASFVIDGFCRFLGIRCLVIRRAKPVDHVAVEGIVNHVLPDAT